MYVYGEMIDIRYRHNPKYVCTHGLVYIHVFPSSTQGKDLESVTLQ